MKVLELLRIFAALSSAAKDLIVEIVRLIRDSDDPEAEAQALLSAAIFKAQMRKKYPSKK